MESAHPVSFFSALTASITNKVAVHVALISIDGCDTIVTKVTHGVMVYVACQCDG